MFFFEFDLAGALGREMRAIYSRLQLEHAAIPWLIEFCIGDTGRFVVFLDPSCQPFGSTECPAQDSTLDEDMGPFS